MRDASALSTVEMLGDMALYKFNVDIDIDCQFDAMFTAGQQRSRMLATLFKDERCQQLPTYGILEKMYAFVCTFLTF